MTADGVCGAVWVERTLVATYRHVCQREVHDDGVHHDGWRTWHGKDEGEPA